MSRFYYSVYGPYIEQYLDVQRSLGYKPKERNSILVAFDRLALERNEAVVGISKELADEWGKKGLNESEINRYKRIQGVRLFASFLCKTGHPSYIAHLPKLKTAFTPYIFTKEQVWAFFDVCDNLDTCSTNRTAVFVVPALFRLLYATGLRISEALSLMCRDVNLKDNYLIVRNSKNGLDRIVPISDALAEVCGEYFEYRDTYSKLVYGASDRFFIYPDGRNCNSCAIYHWFRKVLYKAGISHGGKGIGPRIHDLRHTFACHSLANMAEAGLDLYYSLPILSTYLGHRSLAATDGYIRLTAQMYPGIAAQVNNLSPDLFPDLSNLNEHEAN
jgi:integrase/recombinase XerD